jgi:ABC-type transport system involved in multi-copper enzyme maturation permease subunit
MTGVAAIVRYGLQEAVRRKVFAVVVALTVIFLFLYWLGNHYVFGELAQIIPPQNVDTRTFAASFLFGLAMFATLFLGVVLAVFLTLAAVRGDAERGLLQPLVVRPLGRSTFLAARWLGSALVCIPYVLGVYFAAMLITRATGHWWPDSVVVPGLELAAGVVLVAALSLLGSVFLSGIANGIAVFMVFGCGLVAGLLGSIGHALPSHTLIHASKVAAWILPFEALYEDGLHGITENTTGLTGFLLRLGPFGGAEAGGASLRFWTLGYFVVVAMLALTAFARRDL